MNNSTVNGLKYKILRATGGVLLCLMILFTGIDAAVCRAESENPGANLTALCDSVFSYLTEDDEPDMEDFWTVTAAVRCGLDRDRTYFDEYYRNTIDYLDENEWHISDSRYTEYSKLIIGMTALGKDAADIEGHDLLSYLSDFDKVKGQGINGVIYALIAINCGEGYEIPESAEASVQNSEELMLDYILKNEAEDGGWRIFGGYADVDVTAMTIQALSFYYEDNEEVRAAVDRAVEWLSEHQQESGGFIALLGSSVMETCESTAQVVMALSSIGIDAGTDERFISEAGKSVEDRLLEYYTAVDENRGGFVHVISEDGAPEINGLSSVEGMCAVTSLVRLRKGETSFYDMKAGDESAEQETVTQGGSADITESATDASIGTVTDDEIRDESEAEADTDNTGRHLVSAIIPAILAYASIAMIPVVLLLIFGKKGRKK